MKKHRMLKSVISFVLILSMLITSSSLTRATEQLRKDIDQFNETSENEITSQMEESQNDNLTYEDDDVMIMIDGTNVSDDLKLQVTPVTPQSNQEAYVESMKALAKHLAANGNKLVGQVLYDISLVDSTGNEVHLGNNNTVTFLYKEGYMPANARKFSAEKKVRILEYVENVKGDIVNVSDLSDTGRVEDLQVNGNKEIESAKIQAANAKFSIAWVAPLTQTAEADTTAEEAATEMKASETATTEDKKETTEATENKTEEATTQEVAPETATTEEMAPELATTEAIEESTTESLPEETTPEENVTWEKKVGKSTVHVEAEAGSLPKEAELNVTEIKENDDAMANIQEAVEAQAKEEKFAIENIQAFDINFTVNGEEVQPKTPVQVTIDTPEVEKDTDAAVYHVDDKKPEAESVEGSVDKEGNVEFEAEHFSIYVLVNKTESKHTVSIEHWAEVEINANKEKALRQIYTTDVVELDKLTELKDYAKVTNWDVQSVEKIVGQNKTNISLDDEIDITADTTIKITYIPQTDTEKGAVNFYDYMVSDHGTTGTSFNTTHGSILDDMPQKGSQGLAIGSYLVDHKYKLDALNGNGQAINSDGLGANQYIMIKYQGQPNDDYQGRNPLPNEVAKGIVTGLNGNNVVFKTTNEPGFFVNQDSTNNSQINGTTFYKRKYYSDFKLEFDRSGDMYSLTKVRDKADNVTATAGENFFPLDGVETNYANKFEIDRDNNERLDPLASNTSQKYSDSSKYNNNYYGMRYDIDFTIGDYIGPLYFNFSGDDDLWVLLDGKKVVMDLGGIHKACTDSVDLWKSILNKENYTDADRTEYSNSEARKDKHTLTVLYMERGGGFANCSMNFALPNAEFQPPQGMPQTELKLQKVDAEDTNKGLGHATFELVDNKSGAKRNFVSDGDGKFTIDGLVRGTYTLKEIEPPIGYLLSNQEWTIEVKEVDNDGSKIAVAEMKKKGIDATVHTSASDNPYKIKNQKEPTVETEKTAKVDSWDKRTYDITLNASSTTKIIEDSEPVDVMLVFDRSGSMDFRSKLNFYKKCSVNDTDEKGNFVLDRTKVYYRIADNAAATVYRVWYEAGAWYELDDHFWDYKNNTYKTTAIDDQYTDVENTKKRLLGFWTAPKNQRENSTGQNIYSTEKDAYKEIRNYYVDGDPGKSRLDYLRPAAEDFVRNLQSYSLSSRLGFYTFAKKGESNNPVTVKPTSGGYDVGWGDASKALKDLTATNVTDIINNGINKFHTIGGTQPSLGLGNALTDLNAHPYNKSNPAEAHKRYVVLLTDGCPADEAKTTSNQNPTDAQKYASFKKAIDDIKGLTNQGPDGVTFMTVAVGLDSTNANLKRARDFLRDNAALSSNGNPYAFEAEDGDKLTNVFAGLLASVINEVPVTKATVKDYIDDRFELDTASVAAAGGSWGTDANGTYVIWEDQTLNPKVGDNHGWTKTFKVTAKDTFIGGNNVTTNKDNSGVIINNKLVEPFGKPTVNVKAELKIENKEVTIFKGDQVPKITDDLAALTNVMTQMGVTSTWGPTDKAELAECLDFTWYTDPECSSETTLAAIQMTRPDDDVKYYLKVSLKDEYVKNPTNESKENTTTKDQIVHWVGDERNEDKAVNQEGTGFSGASVYAGELYGVYKINVIKGEIQIEKTLKEADPDNDQTFSFKVVHQVEQGATKLPDQIVSITVPKGTTSASLSPGEQAKLQNLPRGTYTVTEEGRAGYTLYEVSNDSTKTTCQNSRGTTNTESWTFTLGNNTSGTNVITQNYEYETDPDGTVGKAIFKNEKVIKDWEIIKVSKSSHDLKLGGAVFKLESTANTYYGKSESNGKVSWYSDEGCNTGIQASTIAEGTYTFTEIKAPVGYVLSTESWNLTFNDRGYLKSVDGVVGETRQEGNKVITQFIFENEVIYELPSAGGRGIFIYMIGGILCMLGAAFIIIKSREKEAY